MSSCFLDSRVLRVVPGGTNVAAVMKKLALSVAAVVAVVGAIYVLPSALPSSSPDVADRASTVALSAEPARRHQVPRRP